MNLKKLLALCAILILLASYFILPKPLFWDKIDESFFRSVNSMLAWGKPVQVFWALMNHKLHDWLVDVVFLGLCYVYIKAPSLKSQKTKLIECGVILMVMLFSIFFVNKYFMRYHFDFSGTSPSLKFKDYYHINHLLPFLKTKIYARSSFPGDHATTALLFFFLIKPLFSKRLQCITLFYSLLITMPRLVVGAHNLSDILVGSMSLAAFMAILAHSGSWLEKTALKISENRHRAYSQKS